MNEIHAHETGTTCKHFHSHDEECCNKKLVLTIRAHSGLSGDMFLAGLLKLTELSEKKIDQTLCAIMPQLSKSLSLVRREVNHIGGWHAKISLPHEHTHRTLQTITTIILKSGMSDAGKKIAVNAFTLLAKAEASVHGKRPEDIHFHEVGALDSILDICMSCELFTMLAPSRLVVSPLPHADGQVTCAHGIIPVPAPAVLELLEGIPVRPFSGEGETVTPTAMALLHAFGAVYGPWPSMLVEKQALVYGTRIFANAPNGAVFACGLEHKD